MFLFNVEKKIIYNFVEKSKFKNMLIVENGLDIVESFLEYINEDGKEIEIKYNKLAKILWKKNINHITEIFEGKEYEVLKLILGNHHAEIFKNIWDMITDYIYPVEGYRKSFRTNISTKVYLKRNVYKLVEYIYLVATNFSLDKYIQDNDGYYKDEYKHTSIISDLIALEIDKNNLDLIEKVKNAVNLDNNINETIIYGLAKSKNIKSHKILKELILSLNFNDGSKKVLVEDNTDKITTKYFSYIPNNLNYFFMLNRLNEGSVESFTYILESIINNNLIHSPLIIKAFCKWTNLDLDIVKVEIINKCFTTAYNCLIDDVYRNKCIDSDDSILIYFGIWAVGFYECENIYELINKILTSKDKNKQLVALQFLFNANLDFKNYKHQIANELLTEDYLKLNVLVIKNLYEDINTYILHDKKHYLDKLMEYPYNPDMFFKLKKIVDKMSKKEIEIENVVCPWISYKLSVSEILEKMMFSILLSYGNKEVDILINYIKRMTSKTKQLFIIFFLEDLKNSKQKLVIFRFCGDKNEVIRNSAFRIVDSLKLTKEDYIMVEDLMQCKKKSVRKRAVKLLFNQSSEDLAESVINLINSSNEYKRLAAINIVNDLKENGKHKKIYIRCLNSLMFMKDISQKEMAIIRNLIKDI